MRVVTRTEPMLQGFGDAVLDALKVPPGQKVGVVGIPSGGILLAEIVRRACFRRGLAVDDSEVKSQRPSTGMKRAGVLARIVARTIQMLPTAFQDRLRVTEHRLLSTRRDAKRTVEAPTPLEPLLDCDYLVVVDDAIDSGHSMRAVLDFLCEKLSRPRDSFFVAVYVVTQDAPVIEPDFAMLRGVLVRFPWSVDAA